ncbi:MAG: hypothetical protein ACE5HM_04970 [Acidiferrobacterales bacterium]
MAYLFPDLCHVLAIGLVGAEAEVYQARVQSNSRRLEFTVDDGWFWVTVSSEVHLNAHGAISVAGRWRKLSHPDGRDLSEQNPPN